MTNIIGLSSAQISKILKCIHLHLPRVKVFAFGSRVKGSPRKYSDFDVALDAGRPLDFSQLTAIKHCLSETDIPIKVDLMDYHSANKDFKALIDKQKIALSRNK